MTGNNALTKLKKTRDEWEKFIRSDVVNFLAGNELQTITVNDGAGKKATIKINTNGEIKVQITSVETM